MGKIVKLGVIGLGARAETLLATLNELRQVDIEVTAICDVQQSRIDRILGIMASRNAPKPDTYTDYRALIASDNVDAVLVPTSWNSHLKIAEDAMNHGKYVGIEVGGAASVDELWHLVHAAESTGVSCMMLENCCYGRNELLALNFVRKGMIVKASQLVKRAMITPRFMTTPPQFPVIALNSGAVEGLARVESWD